MLSVSQTPLFLPRSAFFRTLAPLTPDTPFFFSFSSSFYPPTPVTEFDGGVPFWRLPGPKGLIGLEPLAEDSSLFSFSSAPFSPFPFQP